MALAAGHRRRPRILSMSGEVYPMGRRPDSSSFAIASFFVTSDPKSVQAVSLLFSLATLVMLYIWIVGSDLIPQPSLKKRCLLFSATLPQFILFGNYISNDSLAFLIGACLFRQV